jgi:molybdenum cofactor cytidylyltransferase
VGDLAAILLAAGRSRRMGAFKPLLPFGDQTVIQKCIHTLVAAGLEEIVVVAGHRADELKEHLRDTHVTCAINADPDSPMGVSVARGIEKVSDGAQAVLIALVDHPAVPSETIRSIVREWKAGRPLVQPEYNGRGGHPVLIDLKFRNELLNLDAARGLRGFFEIHRQEVRRLPVESPYIARDMDTWEDYRHLYEDVFGQQPPSN